MKYNPELIKKQKGIDAKSHFLIIRDMVRENKNVIEFSLLRII